MVLLIIIPMKNCYFIGNISPTFSDEPIYIYINIYNWLVVYLPLWKMMEFMKFHPPLFLKGQWPTMAASPPSFEASRHRLPGRLQQVRRNQLPQHPADLTQLGQAQLPAAGLEPETPGTPGPLAPDEKNAMDFREKCQGEHCCSMFQNILRTNLWNNGTNNMWPIVTMFSTYLRT